MVLLDLGNGRLNAMELSARACCRYFAS